MPSSDDLRNGVCANLRSSVTRQKPAAWHPVHDCDSHRGSTKRICEQLLAIFAVNHPWNAETINKHPKPRSPKSLLDRHHDRSTFCEMPEDTFRFRRISVLYRYGKPFWR